MNQIDLDDVLDRADRKSTNRLKAAMNKWNQPQTETAIGELYEKAKADGLVISGKAKKRMEAIYGQSE
jgi:hypothetical protein